MSSAPFRPDAVATWCAASPFLRTLGAELETVGPGRARLRLAVRPGDVNRNGTLHGGVIASLLAAAGRLAATGVDGRVPAPIDLSFAYLAVGRGGPVLAEAQVLRRGRAIVHVEAGLTDAAGTAVARGLAVLRTGPLPDVPPVPPPGAAPPAEPLGAAQASPSPFSARLGVGVVLHDAGRGIAVLSDADGVRDPDGSVDPGALATLIDAASGASAWSVAGFDPRGRAATLAMQLALHASSRDEDIVADAVAASGADGCHVCSVRLWGRRSRALVASGSATYRITRPA